MTSHTRRRIVGVGAAVVLAGGALTGAGFSASSHSASKRSANADTPHRGGNLVYLDAQSPISAQVQESGYWQDRAILQNVLDRLIYRNPKTHALEPWIASSWKVSDGGKRYDFVIRKGVTYSDGQALDVASVKRNLEWQIKGDSKHGVSPNTVFPRRATVTTNAKKSTVTVQLPAPYAPFLSVLTTWSAGLAANKTIALGRDEQSHFLNLIGSGPFVVTSEAPNKQYVLTARKDYRWAPSSWKNQGAAYVNTVTIIPVQEESVRLGSLKSHQADLLRYVQPSDERRLAESGYQVIADSGVGLSNQWFIRQTAAPYLTDIRVRKALLVGIDRKAIVKTLYSSNWSAATSVLSPGTLGYKDESAKLAYNPTQAKRLLDAAGWTKRNASGYRTKAGTELDIVTFIDVFDNTAPALFQAIQAQLKTIGVNLVINRTDYSSYDAKAWANPKVAVLRTGWPAPDGAISLENQYGGKGTGALSYSGGDAFGLKSSDKKLNSLLLAPLSAPTPADEIKALGAVQDYLLDKAYVIPIFNDTQVYVAGPKLHDFGLTDGGLPEYHNAWLSS
jgi:peptide/nickel transport system substrate-binding protein